MDSVALILDEMKAASTALDPAQLAEAIGALGGARRVFTAGAGRSGLALKMFSMRLMHLGVTAYVAGETTTPAIGAGDLLVVASASGTTAGPVHAAEVARRAGAQVLLLTTAPDSPLGRLATLHVVLRAGTRQQQAAISAQYAGALFEQSVLLVTDAMFQTLWRAGGQTAEQLSARHANLE